MTARIGKLCADRGILYIVDNTMTSPALSVPGVGAGLVNAPTKYIGGRQRARRQHHRSLRRTRFPNIADNYKVLPPTWGIQQIRKKGLRDWGGTLAATDAHHVAVGAETLALRIERVCANAHAVAAYLAAHAKVRAVYFPGLPSHPQHELAKSLLRTFGGTFSFTLDSSDALKSARPSIPRNARLRQDHVLTRQLALRFESK